jgi:hypothetical protein
VWAVGYFADEAYYLQRVEVANLPELSRGQEYRDPDGLLTGARFEPRREGTTYLDSWQWDRNPFVGSRELDGLRVMMVLLNNWDARHANNQVMLVDGPEGREARFMVSDLGATLGRTGSKGKHSKNNLHHFLESGFVESVEGGMVEFEYETRPRGWALASIVYPPYFLRESKREEQFERVAIAHARWIGSLLSRLSEPQLHDAFRAAAYPPIVARSYVTKLRERIQQLLSLPSGEVTSLAGGEAR